MSRMLLLTPVFLCLGLQAQTQAVSISFRAMAGNRDLVCGQKYEGIGTSKSTITPRDFRFYVHNVRVVDAAGKEHAVQLEQDGKWQLDDVALLDFENATGGCSNGTPDLSTAVKGTLPAGVKAAGVRFTMGVPFEKNHTDLASMPSPLNLTALAWVWNAGRKFARLDFSSTGAPRGYAVHLGSTGCSPSETKTTIPTKCSYPNRTEVDLPGFDTAKDFVIVDIASLLQDSNVDESGKMMSGCMSGRETPACKPLLANFGLDGQPQTFFRSSRVTTASR